MNWLVMVLLIVGVVVFIVSFFIPERKKTEKAELKNQEEMAKEVVEKELEAAKEKIKDSADETVSYTIEKTERSLDRLANEKIMAINEYSDTVIQEIQKNHEEAVFLYSMLNDKHANLKKTAMSAEQTAKEVEKAAKTAEEIAKAAKEATKQSLSLETSAEPVSRKVKKQEPDKEIASKQAIIAHTEEKKSVPHEINNIPVSPAGVLGRNNNETILNMHKNGKSNMAIAKELGLGVGEVKLVIDLFKQV